MQIPNVFQTVDSTRCKLYLSIFEQDDQVVTLETGQYNAVTLANHLQDKLTAMGQGVWTVVFNDATGAA